MPLFFFNYASDGKTAPDEVGTEFPSLEAAYLDACESALEMAFEKLRARQDPTTDSFEIVDDRQNLLMQVPFSEVLQPAAKTRSSLLRQQAFVTQAAVAMENCCRQLARGEKLKDELRAEIARARQMFGAIRANLHDSIPLQQFGEGSRKLTKPKALRSNGRSMRDAGPGRVDSDQHLPPLRS
jgi:hypothetical protein